LTPALDEVVGGFGPGGVFEAEAGFEEAGGDDAAAFEDEFGLGAQEQGANLDHPACRGEAEGGAPGLAEDAHEVAVGDWIGRGEDDGAVEIFAGDEEVDGVGEVEVVDPGDELIAAPLGFRRGRSGRV